MISKVIKTENHPKIFLYAFILLLTVTIWHINYCIPLMHDDYMYASSMDATGFVPGTTCDSLDVLANTCYHHYFQTNARTANFIILIINYLGGKVLFNILSTIVTISGMLALSKVTLGKVSICTLCLSMLVYILFTPALFLTFCWYAGALNYLWGGGSLLIAIYLFGDYHKNPQSKRYLFIISLFFFLLAGSMHEMQGCILIGTGILWGLRSWYLHKPISKLEIIIFFTIFLGTCLPLSSPALHSRASSVDYFSIQFLLKTTAFMFKMTWVPSCAFVCLIIYHTIKRNFDILYFTACVAFALAWLMGTHSITGCAYYYYSLTIIIWTLKSISPLTVSTSNLIRKVIVVTSLCCFGTFTFIAWRIQNDTSKVFEEAKENNFVLLDVNKATRTEALTYICALPINTKFIFPFLALHHNIKDFIVIQRAKKGDTSLYEKALNITPNEVAVVHSPNGGRYIRLPKNKLCCIFAGLELHGNSPNKVRASVCPYMEYLHSEILTSLYDRYIAKQKFVNASLDYYKEHVFILIPPTEEKYTSCSFLMQDIQTPKVEKRITIPLDSTLET